MAICYLTGNIIREKDHPIEDDRKSLEHILPNALGGRLKSHYVLTHKANQRLNDEIDKEFNKIFSSFVTRLEVGRDREGSPHVKALHKEYQTETNFKDGRYFPRKPFYVKEKKTIYADSKKTGLNYKKHLIKNGEISADEVVNIMDDLAGELHIPFELGNDIFKKGVGKIAAGFATLKGVSRSNLKDIIDLQKNNFVDRVLLFPYIPETDSEVFFENNIHKSDHFPVHAIVLCGSKSAKFLYCYVELFSAFQFYVLLDADYDGDDVYESYIYDILDEKEISCSEYMNSIPGHSELAKRLPRYRMISMTRFFELTRIAHETLRRHCHAKFNTLSSFVSYVFLSKKVLKIKSND